MKIRNRNPLSVCALVILMIVAYRTNMGAAPANPVLTGSIDQLSQQIIEFSQQGRYREAIPLAKKLVTLTKQFLGRNNSDTAASLNNLAYLYMQIGEYTDAEAPAKEALDIDEKVLGRKHA